MLDPKERDKGGGPARAVLGPPNGEFALRALSVPKASDILADHVRQQILSGALEEGIFLPVERELAESSGLSRGTVREALRILETEGLVEIRPGRHGGTVVRRPGMQPFERSLEGFVLGRRIRLEALLEVRDAVEPVAARMAADRRSDADLHTIETVTGQMEDTIDDLDSFLNLNVAWHVAVAEASHNELIHAMMSVLSDVIRQGTRIPHGNQQQARTLTVRAHRSVVRCIRAGRADEAGEAMRRHVNAFHAVVSSSLISDDLDVVSPSQLAAVDGMS